MNFTEIGKLIGCSKQTVINSYNRTVEKLVIVANYGPALREGPVEVDKPSFDWNNVWKLLEQIPITNDMMDMLWLYFEDGLSYYEVSLRCGVTVSQVKFTFNRLWRMIEASPIIKSDLMIMFSESKEVKKGFKKRRMLENRWRKQMVKE